MAWIMPSAPTSTSCWSFRNRSTPCNTARSAAPVDVRIFSTRTEPFAVSTIVKSVNVPPMSTPSRTPSDITLALLYGYLKIYVLSFIQTISDVNSRLQHHWPCLQRVHRARKFACSMGYSSGLACRFKTAGDAPPWEGPSSISAKGLQIHAYLLVFEGVQRLVL